VAVALNCDLSVLRDVVRVRWHTRTITGVVHRDVNPDNVMLSGGATSWRIWDC